jgi:outer membrane cobalamin receptor
MSGYSKHERRSGAGHAFARNSYAPSLLAIVLPVVLCLSAWGRDARADSPADTAREPQPNYETVVVAEPSRTGSRADTTAFASVITVDRTPRSAESAAELLSELPGVVVTRLGGLGAQSTLSIRGSTADQVGVFLDGIPLNAALGGGVDLGLIPIGDMGRMEIYRGQSPVAFGAAAMGGVVSITTTEIGVPTASVEVGGGSFGTGYGGFQVAGESGRFGVSLGLHTLRSQGDYSYHSDNGTAFDPADDQMRTRSNNELVQTDGVARLQFKLGGRRRLVASFWYLDRDQELPGNGIRTVSEAGLSTRRAIGALRYESPSDLGADSKLSIQAYDVDTEKRFEDRNAEIGLGQQMTRDRTVRIGLIANANKILFEWAHISGVLEGRRETFTPHNLLRGSWDGPPAERLLAAAGLEAQWHAAARLSLVPSVRIEAAHDEMLLRDFQGTYAQDSPENYALPNFRLGTIWRARDWLQLRTNVGRYARLPSLRERFGNTGLFLGNPGLRPETGLNLDAGFVLQFGSPVQLRLDTAAFSAWSEDLIQLERGTYQVRAANLDRALVRGVESSATLAFSRRMHFIGQTTFTDARDTGDIAARRGKQLALRPRWRAYARPELRDLTLVGESGWRWGAYGDLEYTAGNYLDPANLVAMSSRTIWGAGTHLQIATTGFRVRASLRNLSDAQVFDLTGYPLPGRSFWIDLQWTGSETEP